MIKDEKSLFEFRFEECEKYELRGLGVKGQGTHSVKGLGYMDNRRLIWKKEDSGEDVRVHKYDCSADSPLRRYRQTLPFKV